MKKMEKLANFQCDASALDLIKGGEVAGDGTKYVTKSKDYEGHTIDKCTNYDTKS